MKGVGAGSALDSAAVSTGLGKGKANHKRDEKIEMEGTTQRNHPGARKRKKEKKELTTKERRKSAEGGTWLLKTFRSFQGDLDPTEKVAKTSARPAN